MSWTGTPKDWYEQTIGKWFNTDGMYGNQCWDYFDYFCQKIGCTASRHCALTGYVPDLWQLKEKYGFGKWFDFVAPNNIKNGDWVFWRHGSKDCPYGHVAMYYNGKILGQNQNGKAYVTLASNISLSGALGAMRWKGWKIEQPVADDNVTGVARYYGRNFRGQYVCDDDLNLRAKPTTKAKILVTLPKGTVVNCEGYYDINNSYPAWHYWFYVWVNYKGKQYTGFVNGKFITKK
jgi:hypothetical protein